MSHLAEDRTWTIEVADAAEADALRDYLVAHGLDSEYSVIEDGLTFTLDKHVDHSDKERPWAG